MAMAPPRPCPRCGALITSTCARCRRKAEAARLSPAERGYGGDWPKVARAFLAKFPWCGQRIDGALHIEHSRCVQHNERRRAQVVDHIVPLSAGGARLDVTNMQSLCTSCNTAKAYEDNRRPPPPTERRG